MHFFFTVPIPQQSVLFLLVPDMLMNAQTVNWAITTAQCLSSANLAVVTETNGTSCWKTSWGLGKDQSSSGYIWMRAEVFLKTT